MHFITLTSDWGHASHEIAPVKARLLVAVPEAQVLDISHNVPPFNLSVAAQLLSEAIDGFPAGSIHLVLVDTELAEHKRILLAKYKHQFIVAADNGFLSLLEIEAPEILAWEGSPDFTKPFAEKELLIEAAVTLANKISDELPGKPVSSIKTFTSEKPMVEDRKLTGKVIRIDAFGNLVINIDKGTFEAACKRRSFQLILRNHDRHDRIDRTYSDSRDEAGMFCIFNTAGLMEIGLYRDNANKLLGMNVGNVVMIEFGS